MKKILSIIGISLIVGINAASAQTIVKVAPPVKSVLVYSEEEEALVYKSGSHPNANEIIIESLPGFGTDPVPVDISQDAKGSYTFRKHPSLELPEYYTVIITDSLTGKQFDLKKSDSYTFDVAKAMPERFTLQMNKMRSGVK